MRDRLHDLAIDSSESFLSRYYNRQRQQLVEGVEDEIQLINLTSTDFTVALHSGKLVENSANTQEK